MLDLFNIKKKKQFDSEQKYFNSTTKHFSSPLREWDNSIYAFNNNTVKLVPSTTITIINMIKSYFDLFSKKLERKARTKRLIRKIRRISSNKYYISNGGFKHTNNKLTINLYVFNRQKSNYISLLKRKYLKRFFNKSDSKRLVRSSFLNNLKTTLLNLKTEISILKFSNIKTIISNRFHLKSIQYKLLKKVLKKQLRVLKERMNLKKMKFNKMKFETKFDKRKMRKAILKSRLIKKLRLINIKGIKAVKIINKNKTLLIKAFNTLKTNRNLKINNIDSVYKYAESFYQKLIKKSLRKMRMYFYYKQLLFINKSKTNYNYLQHLKMYLQKIYNKNIEFNIINIKRFYLNSDVLSESITMKISKNRRRLYRHLNKIRNKVRIWKKIPSYEKKPGFNTISITKDLSNNFGVRNHINNDLKYKHVTGFRVEASGRLSKRFTASRSMHKLRYKGNLLNINSSYKNMSSNVLRGNLRSNLQYTKLKSKSRIGSFGVRGWVSGN